MTWRSSATALQGAGAIRPPSSRSPADLTRDAVRTRAMAIIGITIACTPFWRRRSSPDPFLKASMGVPGIFALTGVLALAAIAVVRYAVPDPITRSDDRSVSRGQLRAGARGRAAAAAQFRHVRAARGADGAVHANSVRAARQRTGRGAALGRVLSGPDRVDPADAPVHPGRSTARPGKPLLNAAVVVLLARSVALAFRSTSLCAVHRDDVLLRGAEPARGDAAVAASRNARRPMRAAPRSVSIPACSSWAPSSAPPPAVAGRTRGGSVGLPVRRRPYRVWLIGSATMAAPPARFGSQLLDGET